MTNLLDNLTACKKKKSAWRQKNVKIFRLGLNFNRTLISKNQQIHTVLLHWNLILSRVSNIKNTHNKST